MTVNVRRRTIVLEGHCPVEDAEVLLIALQDDRKRVIDVSEMTGAHTAVIQILAMNAAEIRGSPDDEFVRTTILPALPGRRQTNRDFG